MGKWQGRSKKKHSGGRKWPSRKKRKSELGRDPTETKIGARKYVKVPARGKGSKSKLLSANIANITDQKSGKSTKAGILSVLENPANPHFARRNILTKGALIETEIGKARVMSRPGQEDTVNAVLVEGDLNKQEEKEK